MEKVHEDGTRTLVHFESQLVNRRDATPCTAKYALYHTVCAGTDFANNRIRWSPAGCLGRREETTSTNNSSIPSSERVSSVCRSVRQPCFGRRERRSRDRSPRLVSSPEDRCRRPINYTQSSEGRVCFVSAPPGCYGGTAFHFRDLRCESKTTCKQ